ncbi:MAG: DUF3737 family protein [Prevotellaceae bacterium]|jgi:hypothetical protein|nr:DUF3737 family protein [Prevotellaceae bacterium]
MKQIIKDRFFEGERPLFGTDNLRLEQIRFYPGESAVKECSHVEAWKCEFMSKYPFWHNRHTLIDDCLFTVYARAAIWYSQDIRMQNCVVDAPKMFREIDRLQLDNVRFSSAGETIWNCRDVRLRNVEAHAGDYILMGCTDIDVEGFRLQGNYSFQDARNVVVRHAVLHSKDAFWKTENVTIYDSEIHGEYLGWYAKNLRLVNCHISGTQPLCYCTNLVMENCTMADDCDLCFEDSTLQATLDSPVVSVKNPNTGRIAAPAIGQVILDEHCKNPGTCIIQTTH